MRLRALSAVTAALLASAGTLTVAATGATAAPSPTGAAHAARVCARPSAGMAGCHALVRTDASGKPQATADAVRVRPRRPAVRLQAAGATSGGRTVAIVDAYDDPTAEADLGVYRAQYGLPACTTANGCFKKVNQTGGTTYPPHQRRLGAGDLARPGHGLGDLPRLPHPAGRGQQSPSFANLGTAVNQAARTAASSPSPTATAGRRRRRRDLRRLLQPPRHRRHRVAPATTATASSSYPASSHYVTAVGGTAPDTASSTRGWTETAWSGAGSGCSTLNTALTGGSELRHRLRASAPMADVSAVADPNTGVAVYDSTPTRARRGWLVFGGTSGRLADHRLGLRAWPATPPASTTTTRTRTPRRSST